MLSLLDPPREKRATPPLRPLFVPQTIPAPQKFLGPWAAARAAMRNPIELWDEALFELPYREIRRGGQRYLEVMDPALMHTVLVTQEHAFIKSDIQQRYIKPALGDGLLAAEGEKWGVQRPAAAPCFRTKALELLAPTMARVGEEVAERLLQRAGSVVDVMPEMMAATFEVVAELVLGDDAHEIDQATMAQAVTDYVETIALADWIDIAGAMSWLKHRPWARRGQRGLNAMRTEAMRALAKRNSDAREHRDLLARFLAARYRRTQAPMRDRKSVV